MFRLGFGEIIIVLIIALFVFGPDKLPDIGKTMGETVGKFKSAIDGVQKDFDDILDEDKK